MAQPAEYEAWPIELAYNPARGDEEGRLLYEWRLMADKLAETWGIPAPGALKLRSDEAIPLDEIWIKNGNMPIPVTVPSLRGFVLVNDDGRMVPRLKVWFDKHKDQWIKLESLKYHGEWWLVPGWT